MKQEIKVGDKVRLERFDDDSICTFLRGMDKYVGTTQIVGRITEADTIEFEPHLGYYWHPNAVTLIPTPDKTIDEKLEEILVRYHDDNRYYTTDAIRDIKALFVPSMPDLNPDKLFPPAQPEPVKWEAKNGEDIEFRMTGDPKWYRGEYLGRGEISDNIGHCIKVNLCYYFTTDIRPIQPATLESDLDKAIQDIIDGEQDGNLVERFMRIISSHPREMRIPTKKEINKKYWSYNHHNGVVEPHTETVRYFLTEYQNTK